MQADLWRSGSNIVKLRCWQTQAKKQIALPKLTRVWAYLSPASDMAA